MVEYLEIKRIRNVLENFDQFFPILISCIVDDNYLNAINCEE
jgi:hypothetical protein